jgi:transketolase
MDINELDSLQETAFKVREHIIKMSGNGGCFIGASLSCTDILVYLYKRFLNINPYNLDDENRDYLFLSKGHDVPALYGVLVETGIIDKARLKNHLKLNDDIYWHPNKKIPGIEFHSGSLGHLLSVSMGVAYDCMLKRKNNKIVVILGDGELNEGSNWEAILVAAALKLNNLLVIIDRNQFQANIRTEKLIPLEPLERKFEAFDWEAITCNGHDFLSLGESVQSIYMSSQRPSVVIADTIRGRGLPSIENKADRWFCNFSDTEIKSLLKELYTKEKTQLVSETLIVR